VCCGGGRAAPRLSIGHRLPRDPSRGWSAAGRGPAGHRVKQPLDHPEARFAVPLGPSPECPAFLLLVCRIGRALWFYRCGPGKRRGWMRQRLQIIARKGSSVRTVLLRGEDNQRIVVTYRRRDEMPSGGATLL
jgi:hypothetical protein